MPITLGTYAFPERGVAFTEKRGDVAGRDVRTIHISGVFELPSLEAVEAALDEVVRASTADGDATRLSIRAGRELVVRRTGFSREIHHATKAGVFHLDFDAVDPLEAAIDTTEVVGTVSEAAPELVVPTVGNHAAPVVVTFIASVEVYAPGVTDGVRTITYSGVVLAGQTVVFDGESGKGWLDGEDVTAQLAGDFPRISPPETTLLFQKAAFSDLAGSATVSFRDRWW